MAEQAIAEKKAPEIKLFGRWECKAETTDRGLIGYINVAPVVVPRKSHGRHAARQFYKNNVSIVERLMNHMFVPGHRGKRHKYTSGLCSGTSLTNYGNVKKAFAIVEERTKKSPLEVLVRAIENAALREEVSSYQIGSIIARKAVVTSPQRRVDLALRFLVQGAFRRTHGTKKTMSQALADEILAAYSNSKDSFAIQERERLEREAEGAR